MAEDAAVVVVDVEVGRVRMGAERAIPPPLNTAPPPTDDDGGAADGAMGGGG